MSAQSPRPTDSDGMTRRGLMRRTAATGTALGGMAIGTHHVAPRYSPVGRAQAIAVTTVVAVGAIAVGSGVTGWALREVTADEADDPPEGLTPDALTSQLFQTVRTRQSTNASTFVDNGNILDGVEHAAYGDGKIAGIEALNDQKSQSDVQSAATSAVDSYEATIVSNLLKGWNESVREASNLYQSVLSHSDVAPGDVFSMGYAGGRPLEQDGEGSGLFLNEVAYELPNGDSFNLQELALYHPTPADMMGYHYSPDGISQETEGDSSNEWHALEVAHPEDGDPIRYLDLNDWTGILQDIQGIFDDVRNGLINWVDNVYGQVQSGELDTEDLLTPRELAEMSGEEAGVNQAIADLMALNIPVDLEREATITLEPDSASITLKGMLAPTSEPADGDLSAGTVVDPSTLDYDIYFNYDVSQGSGEWLAYESGVDGGVVTFTAEPPEEAGFRITTTAGEKVDVVGGDFSSDDSGTSTVWTVDLSEDLETAITEIDSVEMLSTAEETQYELVQLQDSFTIETYEDSDGNEHDTANFERDEPQDDTNYITQEEWEEMRKRNEELIKKYEEAQEDDDGVTIPDPGDLFDTGGGSMLGLGLIGVVLLAIVGVVTDLIPGLGN